MGTPLLSRIIPAWGLALCLAFSFSDRCSADTSLYNDGVWIVNGVDAAGTNLNQMTVAVGGQPAGSFAELTVFRYLGGGFAMVYSIQADGSLRPVLPPSGVPGGTFHLTGYWDCFAGERLDMRILALNIEPNTKNFKALSFSGSLSNGTTLQATDFSLKLDLPNDSTVRMDVRYTLVAIANFCVDQWKQQSSEGFQVARIASNYVTNDVMYNDSMSVKGFIGPICDCCGCWFSKGYICSDFINQTGSIMPYAASMSGSQLLMNHWQVGPDNTPALRIDIKSPSRSSCSVQGATVLTADPSEDNVNLWINWDDAKSSYAAWQKVKAVRFRLEALLPQAQPCDIFVP